MTPPLRMRHLEVMLAVAAEGSMQRAARRVHLTQPAISKLISEMEAMFSAELFERGRRGVALTVCGQTLALRAQAILNDIDHAYEDLAAISKGLVGHLRIGALAVAESALLPSALLALRRTAPLIRIRIEEGTRAALLDSLKRGELDCVIGRLDPGGEDTAFHCETLARIPVCAIARWRHPLAAARHISLAQLAAYPWILPRAGAPIRRVIDSLFIGAGLGPPVPMVESTSIRLNYELVRATDMIGVMNHDAARAYASQRKLAILSLDVGASLPPVGVIMRSAQVSSAMALFLKALHTASG